MTGDRGGHDRAGERGPLCSGPEQETCARLATLAQTFFHEHLPGSWVPPYLRFRGFSSAVQDQWQTGYAPPGWNALTSHLRTLGWADEDIERAGLARRSQRGNLFDVFRDRAMFPVTAPNGTIAGFIGRASEYAHAGTPKYLNSPRTCLYDKGALLFGLHEARDVLAAGARPVLAEGPLDAIAVTAAGNGRFAGLSPCGTALTVRHLAALTAAADLRTSGVLVAFDSDPAGQRAAIRAYHLLCHLTETIETAKFQPGDDPAKILADHGPPALHDALARYPHPLADVVVDGELQRWERWLRFAEGQVNALRAVAPIIATMPPAHVGRQVARVAVRLSMTDANVTEAVTDAVTELHQRPGTSPGSPPAMSRTRRTAR